MGVFDVAASAIRRSALGADGVFQALAGGDPVAVRVIPAQPDEVFGVGDVRFRDKANLFTIAATDLAAKPVKGDGLTVAGVAYVLRQVWTDSPRRTVWILDCDVV